MVPQKRVTHVAQRVACAGSVRVARNEAAVTLRRLPVTLILAQFAAGNRQDQDFQDYGIDPIETI
jgi:hypothetical protein